MATHRGQGLTLQKSFRDTFVRVPQNVPGTFIRKLTAREEAGEVLRLHLAPLRVRRSLPLEA